MKALYTDTISCEGACRRFRLVWNQKWCASVLYTGTKPVPSTGSLERQYTVHKSMLGITIGIETFSHLYYADDVALLAEMVDILLLYLNIIQQEARQYGLEVNWSKTKIQPINMASSLTTPVKQTVMGNDVEVVDKFVCLWCSLDGFGVGRAEVKR